MVLGRLLYAAERGVVRIQCLDPRMGQAGVKVLVPLLSGVFHPFSPYGFASFIFGCAFDLALLI